jgi:hypothetical protein
MKSVSDCAASNIGMICEKNELETKRVERIVAWFEVLSRNLPTVTEEDKGNLSGQYISGSNYCHAVCVRLSTGFGLVILFIEHLQLATTNNFNSIADFRTLQITTAHAKSFSACILVTRRFLATASNNGYSSAS